MLYFDFSVGFASNEELGSNWAGDELVFLADPPTYGSKKSGKEPTDNPIFFE
jgi:hypothetical protein